MTIDPKRQVFIVSSPEAAAAVIRVMDLQAVAGSAAPWAELAGCKVIIWPTNEQRFLSTAQISAGKAHKAGAAKIRMIVPGPLASPGWDAVMAENEGWDRPQLFEWLQQRATDYEPPVPMAAPEVIQPDRTPVSEEDVRASIRGHSAYSEHDPLPLQWSALKLSYTDKGGPHANETNAMAVLENHPGLSGLVWYDEFLGRIMTTGAGGNREWADADDVRLTVSMQRDLGMTRIKVSHVRAAVIGYAMAHVRNCAQDWITSHKWDGTERIAHFFPDAFGTPDSAYARAAGRNFWISMVARVMQPGCKVDTMVILEGGQGAGKSSVLKAIAGEWFTVQHESITGKGFFEVLQGKMLVEIAEMDAFGKAEVTRVKQVVSTETDRYRESYGRYAKDHPRHSIFCGTTNVDDWNRDPTGARRFWPIPCVGKVDLDSVRRNRAHLFAEALAAFKSGASWWEMPEAETVAEQDARREEDPWTQDVREWLSDIYRTEVTVNDVLKDALGLRRVEMGKPQQMRVASILRSLQWTKHPTATGKVWRRPAK